MEIEMKFICEDKKNIEKNILNEGFEKKNEKHQKDHYYILGEIRNGKKSYLRLRDDLKKEKQTIDYHEVISDIAAEETELLISDKQTAKTLLEKLVGAEICVVDKKRTVYEKDNIIITIDDVKELGVFVEIEIESKEEGNLGKVLEQIREKIGIQENQRIKRKGYPDLLMEKRK